MAEYETSANSSSCEPRGTGHDHPWPLSWGDRSAAWSARSRHLRCRAGAVRHLQQRRGLCEGDAKEGQVAAAGGNEARFAWWFARAHLGCSSSRMREVEGISDKASAHSKPWCGPAPWHESSDVTRGLVGRVPAGLVAQLVFRTSTRTVVADAPTGQVGYDSEPCDKSSGRNFQPSFATPKAHQTRL